MTTLREAATAALEFLEAGDFVYPTELAENLKAALAEPVQQGCDHCNQPLYAAIKCRVCGRVERAHGITS